MKVISLQEIFSMIIKHIKLVILITLIGIVAMVGYGVFREHSTYVTTSQILIKLPKTDKDVNMDTANLQVSRAISTSNAMVTSDTVMVKSAKALESKYDYSIKPDDLKSSVVVTTNMNSQLINVQVTGDNKKQTLRTANMLLKQFNKESKKVNSDVQYNLIKAHHVYKTSSHSGTKAYIKSGITGAIIGVILGAVVALYLEFASKYVIDQRDVSDKYNLHLLGSVSSDK